ncbi:hypothetical protein CXB49_06655 [Chromobacterium sp. ATCC 53434]|uniref:hypothetical protein n=1 Tax=Chromobacterium TaxID=535 RepID=UPI000C77F06A|nr:hypothetical protein [Chromobacterium sp. ATCC 53434]AUH50507.1 hypothetical protein CXB49_06655 [Chromobacterium sp. ATCC 53434]
MRRLLLLATMLALGGCNWVNSVTGLTKESDKAIGAACRQTGRSLEACYLRNPDADKASIYSGWREMNEYMAKNKLETMEPPPEKQAASAAPGAGARPASSAMASPAGDDGQPKPLSSDEADQAAKNDPQVAAVLAAMRNGGKDGKDASGGKHAQGNKGEPDQNRLLNIINQLNKTDASRPPG